MKKNIKISFFLSIIFLCFIFTNCTDNKKLEKRFVYDVEDLKKIDSSQLCYSELEPLDLSIPNPMGIALAPNDDIYLIGDEKLIRYSKSLEKISSTKAANASCLAIDESYKIFAGSFKGVFVYDTLGKQVKEWPLIEENPVITCIAVKDNSVFLADAINKIVYEYNKQGALIKLIGAKDAETRKKGFIVPSPHFDLAIGSNNELWVVNPGLHTLEKYADDGSLITSWKRTSMQIDGFSGCCNPTDIAILNNGDFVTSEKSLVRIKIVDPKGNFKCIVAGPGSFSDDTKGLDLAVNSEGTIIVLDPKRKQIRRFVKNNIDE